MTRAPTQNWLSNSQQNNQSSPPSNVSNRRFTRYDSAASSTSSGSPVHISSLVQGAAKERIQQVSLHRTDRKNEQHNDSDEESRPLLNQTIQRSDGTEPDIVLGQSSLPQTIFNSTNVLIGISMLSLPLSFTYVGWVLGLGLLVLFAIGTRYTAELLGKCLDVDSSLRTYGDVAYIAFGQRGRILTSVVFNFELISASVALVILFADSLDSLIPGYGVVRWKILCGLLLTPLNFLPMRLLSYTSFVGILCVLAVMAVIIVDGLLKTDGSGSLWTPAITYLFPQSWSALPLSFGLIMAPFGGHAVFCSIYRDMRQPWKYSKSLNYTFIFTWVADTCMAAIGWLMFGNSTRDIITTNILLTDGYPKWLDILLLVFIAIIPLTKFPLTCAPVISTIESMTYTCPNSTPTKFLSAHAFLGDTIRFSIRLITVLAIVLISILIPSFEIISAFLGAAFGFLICIVLPLAFHIKIFGSSLSRNRRILEAIVMVVGLVAGVVGTVWEFLPREWLGIDA